MLRVLNQLEALASPKEASYGHCPFKNRPDHADLI